ncbi:MULTISPECIES: glycosyltransferase [Flavobacterium]|uniref:glycosyltransferase n=1 Tax=Flavobacterium TaxID=237 RepID=UPI001FCBD76E|nr:MULTISPECIES: glycosyltransferase [Flavobacterium]UOK43166.1 glycosyltransferase [Flavobacterium enshiense]
MNNTIVLIPHYNNFTGLLKTIKSINADEKIDVLIVDDGSNTDTINADVLKKSVSFNGQLHIEYLPINSGIEEALNKGLMFVKQQSRYQFIARIDCGDVVVGKRFQKQECFLTENPDVALLGCNAIAVDINDNELYRTVFPEEHEVIKHKMYLNAMFLHPCVMFRSMVLKTIGVYPTEFEAAEDYAYFFSIMEKYKTHNLQDFLVKYEINPNGISLSKRKKQVKSRIQIIRKHFYFGFWPCYGLVRNYLLLYIPNILIQTLKKWKS